MKIDPQNGSLLLPNGFSVTPTPSLDRLLSFRRAGSGWDDDSSSPRSILALPAMWEFTWGRILSGHDSKGSGTFITVAYGNRREEANRKFRSRLQ